MALNWAMLNEERKLIPLPHEMVIEKYTNAEISLMIPDAPPTAASTAGGSGGMKRLKSSGDIHLTDQRLIFISKPTDKSRPSAFETLSVPLRAVLSTRFEQPTFAANYLSFEVKPSPGGQLTDGTKVEVRFIDRAMFEFVSLLEKSRERTIFMERQPADDEEGLPSYTNPAGSSTVEMVGGIPIDNPPSYD